MAGADGLSSTRAMLVKHGLHFTAQRAALYEALQATVAHPTAEELYHDVRPCTRSLSLATVYSALDRLVSKGLVSSKLGQATPERGGRAKKLFRVEPEGVRALEEARQTLETMWQAGGLGVGSSDG